MVRLVEMTVVKVKALLCGSMAVMVLKKLVIATKAFLIAAADTTNKGEEPYQECDSNNSGGDESFFLVMHII